MAAKKVEEKKMGNILPKDENGCVKWREIVNISNVILSKTKFATIGVDVTTLSEEEKEEYKKTAPDEFVYISLGGARELAEKRGMDSYISDMLSCERNNYVARAIIHFLPTAEEPAGVTFSGIGSASEESVNFGFKYYLPAISENRAFARCVRNFFKIKSLYNEEAKTDEKPSENTVGINPIKIFKDKLEKKNWSFEELKAAAEKAGYWKDEWKSITDLKESACFILSTKLFPND